MNYTDWNIFNMKFSNGLMTKHPAEAMLFGTVIISPHDDGQVQVLKCSHRTSPAGDALRTRVFFSQCRICA